MRQLLLASTSPRRRILLERLERAFRVVAPKADESVPPGLPAHRIAEDIAVRKAESVAAAEEDALILAADTLVAAEGDIIGKPTDRAHAIAILERLCRGTHDVITGICLIDTRTGERRVASERTRVTMRPMTRAQIEAYVDSGEAAGKAGAYAIQETGDRFVERVEGSFSNVVGLPLELLARLLDEMERPKREDPVRR